MKTKYIIYTALFLVIGFLVYNKFFSEKAKKIQAEQGGGGGGGKKGGAAVPVTILVAKDTVVNSLIQVTGSISANEQVNLTSQIAGNITSIYFDEGSKVKKGQLLVKVYDKDILAQLKQNEYLLKLAKENEGRNKVLLQKEAISQQEYDTSLSSYNTYEAQAEFYRAQIDRTEIRAPFSGRIGLRNVSPGSYLSPQSTIATLVNDDPVKITFTVPERYRALMSIGNTIEFSVDGIVKKFEGRVYAIEPNVNTQSRSVVLRAKAANPNGELVAGSFAKIDLTLDKIPSAIMIPTQAVQPILKGQQVFVMKKGKAVPVVIKTDIRSSDRIQVIDGIKPGDSVVTSGLIQVTEGTSLKVTNVIN
ncbi:MAG: efflux RND transporter periplasmic adaptor subunit [Mucilaginibacter polytrichastri]|nr:efflux RND transporter periplasmic adaptor subunit [Mucilaginibacter polytrichastri]